MVALQLLADMNISPITVDCLRGRGWETVRVSDVMPSDSSDEDILERARREGRVLVTADLDFSALLALSGRTKPSVINLRLTDSSPASTTRRLIEVLPALVALLTEGTVVTVEDVRIRVRRLPVRS